MGRYSIKISDKAKKELVLLHRSGDKILMKRIEKIFEELGDNPYAGTGKPEQLRYNLSGLWSRRLDRKNRIVYEVLEEIVTVFIIAAKGHYSDK
ncbi:Txe/YoeB family addiction module toxin [Dyadobacter sp. CY356]|uniref:Txe/YoeB family addiction module toxin n=1 Tax=Dyadobacter sp. CY356 TaxID=2906442 RepID=UPI001F36FA16|nr:Txe/YoeB family addiction module toxin [Dyadobacter sp. CY356]MCF0058234.1 Txe/YoeB family addiction module toxin [Dyadobacter sp. CY356]